MSERSRRRAAMLVAFTLVVAALTGAIVVYSGVYNVAADDPHSALVFHLAETVRQRSIAARAASVEVPPLDEPGMLTAGGADYNDMCAGCHLAPGRTESDLASGMYPRPPNLTEVKRDPAQAFWIIKHGIKMSGMPAWGATHDDARIWAMVAFLRQLPRLTPDQYQILTARADVRPHGERH